MGAELALRGTCHISKLQIQGLASSLCSPSMVMPSGAPKGVAMKFSTRGFANADWYLPGWIDSKHGLEHLLQPDRDGDGRPDQPDAGSTVEYDVQVFTSDIRGAATSAEVFVSRFWVAQSLPSSILDLAVLEM